MGQRESVVETILVGTTSHAVAILLVGLCGATSSATGCWRASAGADAGQESERVPMTPSLDGGAEWCAAASQHLSDLGCAEASPEYARYCEEEIDAGRVMRPLCLSNLPQCSAYETCFLP